MFKITRILTSYEWGGTPDAGNPFLAPWRRPIIDSMIIIQTISSSILILSGTNRSWILLGSRDKYSTAAWLSNILCMVMVTFLVANPQLCNSFPSFCLGFDSFLPSSFASRNCEEQGWEPGWLKFVLSSRYEAVL